MPHVMLQSPLGLLSIVQISLLLILSGCQGAGLRMVPVPTQNIASLSPRDILERLRFLALSEKPDEPTLYEPLLGLETMTGRSWPNGVTAAELRFRNWDGADGNELRVLAGHASPARRPSVDLRLRLPPTTPCMTLDDVVAINGPHYRQRPIIMTFATPQQLAEGIRYFGHIDYPLSERPRRTLSFDGLNPCLNTVSIFVER